MTERKLSYVYGNTAVSLINDYKICTSYTGIVKSGTLKRTAIGIKGCSDSLGVTCGMTRAEGIVIRAEAFQIIGCYRATVRTDSAVKVCISAHDVDSRNIVNVAVVKRILYHSGSTESPSVNGDVQLVYVNARELIVHYYVAVGGKSSGIVYRIVFVSIGAAGRYNKGRIRAVLKLSYKHLSRSVRCVHGVKNITAHKNNVHPSVTHVLHHSAERISQLSAALLALFGRETGIWSIEMNISAL